MILERGNMWDVFGKTGMFMITTNPIARKDGGIVMGRGIAKEMATKYPKAPYDFAEALAHCDYMDANTGEFAVYDGQIVGWFMVKSHWRLPAELTIIEDSLVHLILAHEAHKLYRRIDLNFPGIGNGKLGRDKVLPLLEKYLPDNVHVWEY